MLSSQLKLGWALSATGHMMHVRDVVRGKGCDCVCPDCNTPLIARQGEINRWHFQHATSITCSGESALHRAAKQIIEAAARAGKTMSVPGLGGTIELIDMRNHCQGRPWHLPKRWLCLASASIEPALSGELRPDVVVMDDTGVPYAIEVYVTHKKTEREVGLYRSLGHEAIEIDLSQLSWDADGDTILQAVLSEADKRWLYTAAAEHRYAEALHDLSGMIEASNKRMIDGLDSFMQQVINQDIKLLSCIEWPLLSATAHGQDAFKKPVQVQETVRPIITSLTSPWNKERDGIWRGSGLVNGKSTANLFVIIDGMKLDPPDTKTPALVALWCPEDMNLYPTERLASAWQHIDRWKQKLTERAYAAKAEKIQASEEQMQHERNFQDWFREQGDWDKLLHLTKKLNLECTAAAGSRLPAWNTTWAVWRTLVWLVIAESSAGRMVDTRKIARDEWFGRMLGWPMDKEAVLRRENNLWFFFRDDLCSRNIASHVRRSQFLIAQQLPTDFKPWQQTKT